METVFCVAVDPVLVPLCRGLEQAGIRVRLWRAAAEALAALEEKIPAVVLTQQRLPDGTGLALLDQVRARSPDTMRLLFDDRSEPAEASRALAEERVHHLVPLPCDQERLLVTVQRAIGRHRRRVAERAVLEKTLKGALNALAEVLTLLDPDGMGRTAGLHKMICALVRRLGQAPQWWYEPMARLCNLGWASLPPELRRKVNEGRPLSDEEQRLYWRHPEVGAEILSNIPRLEPLAEAIRYQEKHYDGGGFPDEDRQGEEIPLGARLLKVVLDYQRARDGGLDEGEALSRMRWQKGAHDPRILAALEEVLEEGLDGEVLEIDVPALEDGMVLRQDLHTLDGQLLARRGQVVSPLLRRLVYNFWENHNLRVPLRVSLAEA